MSKLKIAVVTGGFSSEREIALNGSKLVMENLDTEKFESYLIVLNEDGWICQTSSGNFAVNKNDFSVRLASETIKFDAAFIIIHGTPAEDGKLQGYFDLLKIPYSAPSVFTSALTMNKSACKQYLQAHDIKMAASVCVRKNENGIDQKIIALTYPLFIKPNNNGSSYGVSKISKPDELNQALQKAFEFDSEIIVEEFIEGREFSNGVVICNGQVLALPVTEIKSQNDFFDYKAKYLGESKEITPAEIDDALANKCKKLSEKIYRAIHAKGMCRMDYILHKNEFYFLEVNTIPGLSGQSIVPQQAIASGMTLKELFGNAIREAVNPTLIL